jgi:hypothetical protein
MKFFEGTCQLAALCSSHSPIATFGKFVYASGLKRYSVGCVVIHGNSQPEGARLQIHRMANRRGASDDRSLRVPAAGAGVR